MLRKSLQALFVATLLALAAVVAYASLLPHVEATVDKAEALIARRQYAHAVTELGYAERSARGDLLERVRRLRYDANTKLDNAAAALIDVELLIRDGHGDDETLLLDRIRLLAKNRDGNGALLAAQQFLERWPGHSRALELAGEACQTLYQPLLRDVDERLERNVAQVDLPDARTAMLGYVYRPDGDPAVQHSFDELRRVFSSTPRLTAEWTALERDMRALRERVQQGQGYFRHSLEARGEPVAAFQQFAWALDQSRRIDDLLVACEIQRRCFDHKYVDGAGAEAAWALLRDGQYAAAIATADRWLPPGAVQRRIGDDRLTTGTTELLLARAFAAWRLGDPGAQSPMWRDIGAMWEARVPPVPVMSIGPGLFQLGSNAKEAESSLRYGLQLLQQSPPRPGRLDVLAAVMPQYLELLLARNAGEDEVQAVLTQWTKARPASIEPSLALADFLARRGRTAAALSALDDAHVKHPDDKRIVDRRVDVMRQHVRGTDQDGPALLAQCLERRVGVPEVRDPLGFLLCGEAALASETWWIARACARRAIEEMQQARAPRLLQLRVSLAEKQYDDAVRHGHRLLELMPPDAETVALTLQACRAAGLPRRDVLAAAITTADNSPLLQIELLRAALADRPRGAAAAVTPAALAPTAPAELRILAAEALANAGDHARAAPLLLELATDAGKLAAAEAAQLSSTVAAWVELAAPDAPDAWFAVELERLLARIGPCTGVSAKRMLDAAVAIAKSRPKTASVLCTHALAGADAEDRNGRIQELAGRLAASEHEWRRAEDAWTGALAFADGGAAAEPLARLCLAQGHGERALQIAQLVEKPTDAALLLRLHGMQNPAAAAELLAADLANDRADLIAQATLAAIDAKSTVTWPEGDASAQEARLELLAILHDRSLGPLALERARALHATNPDAPVHRMLLARALADAGQAAEAMALHQALLVGDVKTPELWREVALAADDPAYTVSPDLMAGILAAITTDKIADSPVTLAFAADAMKRGFSAGGRSDAADQLQLSRWMRAPRGQPLKAADVELIARGMRPGEAWYVIDQALTGPQQCDRLVAVDRLHQLAAVVMQRNRAAATNVYDAARRYLDRDGPRGSIVHFLIGAGEAVPEWRLQPDERARLLRRHLELAASGRDGDQRLPATVRALVALDGADAVLTKIDALLREYPTAMRLWIERARLCVGTRNEQRALDDLRAVLRRVEAPGLRLDAITLAAETRSLTPGDLAWWSALPQSLQSTPEGAYAAGMVALRYGNPDAAVPFLSVAAPRADGMHLFAIGLALLQSTTPDAPHLAREAFAMLARDYPSSSLARNAGSFANQLAPR